MEALRPFCFIFIFFVSTSTITGHNITNILSAYPEYSLYSSYLSQTKLADEINNRQTITVLVLSNDVMQTLAAKQPLSVIKNALSFLTILDYFDGQKLHGISDGSTLRTTLYQTTGNAPGNLGFVNITDLRGGKVGFGSTVEGTKLDSTYTKSIKQIPYNISVLEISKPILFPALLSAPAPSAADVNITGLLEKAGCKTFASLILSSGVLKSYENFVEKGLTIFAPSDMAFEANDIPDIRTLSSADLVALLQYHAIPGYNPKASLKDKTESMSTLATSGAGKFALNVTANGDDVTLLTGVAASRVSETVLDDTPLCILKVDHILLPTELFSAPPTPAPAPAPIDSLVPSPSVSPVASAPSELVTPPAPPPLDDEPSAESPHPMSKNLKVKKSNAPTVKIQKVTSILFLISSWVLAFWVL